MRSNLTVKFLGEMVHNMWSMTKRLQGANLVMEHYLKFKRGLDGMILPYKELHQNLRQSARQLLIMDFFHPGPSTSGASAPSPASLPYPASPASPSVSDSSEPSPASTPSPPFLSVHNSSAPSPAWFSDDSPHSLDFKTSS